MAEQRDLAKALESLARGEPTAPAARPASPRPLAPGRPSRPATPNDLRPAQPAPAAPAAHLAHEPKPSSAKSKAPSGTNDVARTLLPVALTLALTLPILGLGWFALEPTRVIRSIPVYVPLGLTAAGVASALVAAYLWRLAGAPARTRG